MIRQQGDVRLFQTPDGGDITVENGLVAMDGGLETAVYLSLFGGNEDDPGVGDSAVEWWGNLLETEPARRYRSETQYLLNNAPPIPANLRRIADAAVRDLEFLINQKIATAVEAEATIPALNTVRLVVQITVEADPVQFVFVETWKASR